MSIKVVNLPAVRPTDDWDQHWLDFSRSSESAPASKYRRRLAFQLLDVNPSNPTVHMLEIGSATGKFAEEFYAQNPLSQFLGVDLSGKAVEIARRRVPRARFVKRNLLVPLESGETANFKATHALCSEVLEHIDTPNVLLRNAISYMGPNCKLVVTVPGGKRNKFDEYIGHRRHYTSAELRNLLENAGFEVEQVYEAGFPFFNLYRMLTTLRGERLIDDVSCDRSALVRIGTVLFDVLFHFNLIRRWGWQILAVARLRR
jgi:SAM-dependent methyltransferase